MKDFKKILDRCKCGVFLTINQHRDYYQTAEQALKEMEERGQIKIKEEDPGMIKRMVDTNTIYELQFYPDTPIGSYVVYGTSVEEVVEQALGCLKEC